MEAHIRFATTNESCQELNLRIRPEVPFSQETRGKVNEMSRDEKEAWSFDVLLI